MATKTQTAWGVRVTTKGGDKFWGWLVQDALGSFGTPPPDPSSSYRDNAILFRAQRGLVMGQVKKWRSTSWVRKAVAKRVELPVPEGE